MPKTGQVAGEVRGRRSEVYVPESRPEEVKRIAWDGEPYTLPEAIKWYSPKMRKYEIKQLWESWKIAECQVSVDSIQTSNNEHDHDHDENVVEADEEASSGMSCCEEDDYASKVCSDNKAVDNTCGKCIVCSINKAVEKCREQLSANNNAYARKSNRAINK